MGPEPQGITNYWTPGTGPKPGLMGGVCFEGHPV